ncbi:MAG: cysteine--tRNA ligase [Holosporales bacterium]|nr:cysteine--tRNA ligase [Holosporales bacterium]
MVRLYNSLNQRVEPFVPLDETLVRMYVCGPTVYDRPHVGNARPIVVFDLLYRLLAQQYPRVVYVRNITDIDDKINARAAERGLSIKTLTEEIETIFHEDLKRLGVLPPTFEPHATDHVPDIIRMVLEMQQKEYAYANEGHVLFRVRKDPQYGCLSRRKLDDMLAGSRVEVAPYKEDPLDFVLWKPSTPDLPGWESPWGRGRPGWHIECSAMCLHYFGPTFDIHGGGQDLMFPHHENEIAQSRAVNEGALLAHTWVHNGIVLMEGQKMSKSLGNILPLNAVLQDFEGEVVRHFLLSTHYRKPLDWTRAGLEQSKQRMTRLYGALREFLPSLEEREPPAEGAVLTALQEDLNTAQALSLLDEMAAAVYKETDSAQKRKLQETLRQEAQILGFLGSPPEVWLQRSSQEGWAAETIEQLLQEREEARQKHDFARADAIRDQLLQQGVILEDTETGTRWQRA